MSYAGVLTQQGQILMWGSNDEGQLGLGDHAFRRHPQMVTVLKDRSLLLLLVPLHALRWQRR
jgi:alpha-tubulin suppressor-like RCC1 family protein